MGRLASIVALATLTSPVIYAQECAGSEPWPADKTVLLQVKQSVNHGSDRQHPVELDEASILPAPWMDGPATAASRHAAIDHMEAQTTATMQAPVMPAPKDEPSVHGPQVVPSKDMAPVKELSKAVADIFGTKKDLSKALGVKAKAAAKVEVGKKAKPTKEHDTKEAKTKEVAKNTKVESSSESKKAESASKTPRDDAKDGTKKAGASNRTKKEDVDKTQSTDTDKMGDVEKAEEAKEKDEEDEDRDEKIEDKAQEEAREDEPETMQAKGSKVESKNKPSDDKDESWLDWLGGIFGI